MEHQLTIKDLSEIQQAAKEFIASVQGHSIIAFYAPMGAGKTTFTTALCHELGVSSEVNSPTFAIVNEYRAAGGRSIFHFDFYRIRKIEEALDIGLYDYLDSGELCILEWPENIEALLPDNTLKVSIKVLPDQSRLLSWQD